MQNEMNKIVKTLRKTLRAKLAERDRFEREMQKQLREFDQGISRIQKSIEALAPAKAPLKKGKDNLKGKERVMVDTTTKGRVRMSKRRYLVLKALVDHGTLSVPAIQEVARKEHSADLVDATIRSNLTELRKMGLVKNTGRGVWSVAD